MQSGHLYRIQVYRNPPVCQSPISNGDKGPNVKIQMTIEIRMPKYQNYSSFSFFWTLGFVICHYWEVRLLSLANLPRINLVNQLLNTDEEVKVVIPPPARVIYACAGLQLYLDATGYRAVEIAIGLDTGCTQN